MSDAPPASGHNLPPIAKLADEMAHAGVLWANNVELGEKHEAEIKVRAYQLRAHAEDPDTRLLIGGLLRDANIPQTKRSDPFTQYLHLAFRKAKVRPEKSQISRWAGALKWAWLQDPRPTPDALPAFIKGQGGDVECARKARDANRAGSGGNSAPQAIPFPLAWIANAYLSANDGKAISGRLERTEIGVQFVPNKRIDLQAARERLQEKLSQMRQPAAPSPVTP
jgi:hypothetical protein